MKTNYAQHLAWFQHTVQPHVMTRDSEGTRCWYPTLKRPVIPFEQWREENMHNPEGIFFFYRLKICIYFYIELQ